MNLLLCETDVKNNNNNFRIIIIIINKNLAADVVTNIKTKQNIIISAKAARIFSLK